MYVVRETRAVGVAADNRACALCFSCTCTLPSCITRQPAGPKGPAGARNHDLGSHAQASPRRAATPPSLAASHACRLRRRSAAARSRARRTRRWSRSSPPTSTRRCDATACSPRSARSSSTSSSSSCAKRSFSWREHTYTLSSAHTHTHTHTQPARRSSLLCVCCCERVLLCAQEGAFALVFKSAHYPAEIVVARCAPTALA